MGHGWSSWKNHVPEKPVRVHAGDKTWSGSWRVDGGDLVLSSAYGCRRAPIGGRKEAELAGELMREILVDYATHRRPSLGPRNAKSAPGGARSARRAAG